MSQLLEEYRTRLRKALVKLEELESELCDLRREKDEPIAILGVALRGPGGASSPEAFFHLLAEGRDTVREAPRERFGLELSEALDADTRGARWGAFLNEDVSAFDAAFFGISPREARAMDPQQRLLLEVTWEALERAGQVPDRLLGSRAGVFLGMTANDYAERLAAMGPSAQDIYTGTGNNPCFAAGRLSYLLGLTGPSMTVNTACSSSLVAVHLGCQSLQRRESSLVVAGGVHLMLSSSSTRLLAKTGALSPDGRSKTFDAGANGYVRGEGCGVMVLKRLSDAERDGDPILAVIRGSAVNQDGKSTGLTAPNVLAQQALLRSALESARLSAEDIDYIEAHGTGTSLGDPIEFEALRAVLGKPRADGSRCVLGALKTNVGHLEAAAGVAGLIKAVLCLQHEAIPRNLHFEALNPQMSLEGTPFMIPTETVPWRAGERPRRAGVSSFGMSGTNAHVILEEAPRRETAAPLGKEATSYLLPLSAKSPEALVALARSHREALSTSEAHLHAIAFTASARRSHHEHRLAVTGRSKQEIGEALEAFVRGEAPAGLASGRAPLVPPKVVFVFPGQGSQWAGMGRALLAEEPVFREALTAWDARLLPHTGFSLLDELARPEQSSRLGETVVAQPALFAIGVALAALLASWGIRPDAVLGHSVGEIAAAHVAGVLDAEEAARLCALRGRIMQKATGHGKMVSVALGEVEALHAISGHEDRIGIAAVNDPGQVVLAGEVGALDALVSHLSARGVQCRELRVDYAFHSPQMEPLRRELVGALYRVTPRRATIPMYSTVTGDKVSGEELDAAYWGNNLRQTVRFERAVGRALEEGYRLFVEVGPHPVLSLNVEQCLAARGEEGHVVATLRRRKEERQSMLSALGALYARGRAVDWERLFAEAGRVVTLPTYPWQRERHWIEGASVSPSQAPEIAPHIAAPLRLPLRLGERLEAAEPEERRALLEEHVIEQVGSMLRLDPARIERDALFTGLGMDSMMSLELRNQLQASLGLQLPATLLFTHATPAALVEHLFTKLAERALAEPTPPPARPALLPLSAGQERLWFLDRLAPGMPLYNCHIGLRVRGALDREALRRSFDAVVQRHEALRTRFVEIDGEPRQVIAPPDTPADLTIIEVHGLNEEARRETMARRADEAARHPFDLAQGPLLRAVLLIFDEDDACLFVTQHHIITDGWSTGVLFQELAALYRAFVEGRRLSLSPLPLQFADLALREHAFLAGEEASRERAYWKEKLRDLPPLELPTDRTAPAVRSHDGATASFTLSPALTGAIDALARREGCTPFMVLFAAFAALLHRYAGQADFGVGTVIANRGSAPPELIGFLVNTLVLRCDFTDDPSFLGWLSRARTTVLEAFEHQALPFGEVVRATGAPRGGGLNPLVRACFTMENLPAPVVEFPGMTWTPLSGALDGSVEGTAKFDLSLVLMPIEGGLAGMIEYATDLFDASTVARMARHFQALLQAVTADASPRISRLPLLAPEERREILAAWNDTARDFPADACIHDLIEAQAQRTPEATAVTLGSNTLCYAELDRRANQLAHHLRRLGVGPEVLVGLYVERSLEMIVGLLGILKAGGAYVPLDPSYPRERLAFMLKDSRASVLLTHSRLVEGLPEQGAQLLCLDTMSAAIAAEDTRSPARMAKPENVAYVIYTSGSTGTPKGVLVAHRGACNLAAEARAFGIGAGTRLLQVSRLGFDAAAWEVFSALANGAVLCLVEDESTLVGAELARVLREQEISAALLVPSALSALPEESLPGLRSLIAGAEPCSAELVDRWSAGRRFFNAYGPTEASVITTIAECHAGTGRPPIGRPIANARVHILDRHLEPVPVGVAGELYIGGVGVARGYHRRAALTAERFVPDPFSTEPGARLYRTGDLVRWRADGNIEFLGRVDHQIKLRGFRIELGEIESALVQHPAVRDAVVLAREDVPSDPRLVAYLVPREAPLPGVSELRSYLHRKLPEYMVPAAFIELSELPRSPNGKVDRRALRAPTTLDSSAGSYVAPTGDIESTLAAIWAKALGFERVGVHDNFFDLGGHSLAILRVRRAIEQQLGRSLTVVDLFQHPTVAALARFLAPGPAEQGKTGGLTEEKRAALARARQDEQRSRALAARRRRP
uniref:Protease do n=1 Tax=Racemicystis crocea TaxID=1707966 RepID=A0A3S7V0P7_9BACT|nr:protease do [Racemicystis crocea]